MIDQLSQLSLMIKIEAHILQLCLQSAYTRPVHNQGATIRSIEGTLSKIVQEKKNIATLIHALNMKTIAQHQEQKTLHHLIPRLNKILNQNERIFTSSQQFKNVVRKVLRLYSSPQQQNQHKQYQESPMIDIISQQLKELDDKIVTHRHQESEQAIKEIQLDNALIQSEIHLVMNENTELLHAQQDLKMQLLYVRDDNERLEDELNQMKVMMNRIVVHTTPIQEQERKNQWILVPKQRYDQD